MDRRLLLVSIPILCFLGVVSAVLLYHAWFIIGEQEMGVYYRVVQPTTIGFDVNRSALHFGSIPVGGMGKRNVTFNAALPAVVHVTFNQELGGRLTMSENPVYLTPGIPAQVTFFITIPENATVGNYTGAVRIRYVRRMPWQ